MIQRDSGSPWTVLGISPGASEDEIRTSYRTLVKRHSPERDPDAFERIRDAYERIRDPRVMARERVFGPEPFDDPEELVAELELPRRGAGIEAWIAALKELSP